MHHNGVWYRPSRSQRFRSHFANYTVIALLRDPRRRALSAYEWALPNAGKPGLVSNTVKRIFSFKRFLSDVPFIARFSRKSRKYVYFLYWSNAKALDRLVCLLTYWDFCGCFTTDVTVQLVHLAAADAWCVQLWYR